MFAYGEPLEGVLSKVLNVHMKVFRVPVFEPEGGCAPRQGES